MHEPAVVESALRNGAATTIPSESGDLAFNITVAKAMVSNNKKMKLNKAQMKTIMAVANGLYRPRTVKTTIENQFST